MVILVLLGLLVEFLLCLLYLLTRHGIASKYVLKIPLNTKQLTVMHERITFSFCLIRTTQNVGQTLRSTHCTVACLPGNLSCVIVDQSVGYFCVTNQFWVTFCARTVSCASLYCAEFLLYFWDVSLWFEVFLYVVMAVVV